MPAKSHKLPAVPSKKGPRAATVRRALVLLENDKTRWHQAEAVVADILSTGLRDVRHQRGSAANWARPSRASPGWRSTPTR